MFALLGRGVVKLRWLVVAAAVALVVVGVTWGAGVFNVLASGGFDDPKSESVRAAERIASEVGRREVDVVVLYSSDEHTVNDPAFRDAVTATMDELRKHPEVAGVFSYYDRKAPFLVSEDQHATYVAVTFDATDDQGKRDAYDAVASELDAPGLKTEVGGLMAFQTTADEMAARDIARGEGFAMPVVLLLLILVFGGVVAASMPVLIGILAILGALTTTRLLTTVTDVSTFAVNTITLLGLGMAIDYSLLIVSRYREELKAGYDTRQAIVRTMSTAGRTVFVSGLTIALALASLLTFPQVFLRSMGMGGMAAVLVAMLGALTVLPALLAILGPRINAWRVPLPWQRRQAAAAAAPAGAAARSEAAEQGGWARLAHSVMRRPLLYITGVVVVLGVLASPFLRAEFGGADERVLPPGTEARVVSERIAEEFPGGSSAPIETFVGGASADQVRSLVADIEKIPGVTGAQVTAGRGDATLVSVSYEGPRTGDQAYDAVRTIRDLPTPPGVEVLVGGRSAGDVDRLDSLGDRLPWMALFMAAVTLVLLFFAFGSVLLPIQAVLMNLFSIGASFGVLVWIFQDGNLADTLGFTPTGFIEPTIPILVLVILFGVATDYQVFLASRIREEWDTTGDNTAAVARGLQQGGPIITAAALLLLVVVAGFSTGGIVFIKMIGIGMMVAIIVDATLVRTLLVPASLRLLGRWTWWAPGPLARVYRRYGIRESARPEAASQEPSLVR